MSDCCETRPVPRFAELPIGDTAVLASLIAIYGAGAMLVLTLILTQLR